MLGRWREIEWLYVVEVEDKEMYCSHEISFTTKTIIHRIAPGPLASLLDP